MMLVITKPLAPQVRPRWMVPRGSSRRWSNLLYGCVAVATALTLSYWSQRRYTPAPTYTDPSSISPLSPSSCNGTILRSVEMQKWVPPDRMQNEKDGLARVWQDLQTLFADNPPHPNRVMRPYFNRLGKKALSEYTSKKAAERGFPGADNAAKTRSAHANVVSGLPEWDLVNANSLYRGGRGIVILAGGKYSGYAATTLGMLRQSGSKLPVEVWMKNGSEDRKRWCSELAEQGAVCRMLAEYIRLGSPSDWFNPFSWLKSAEYVPWSAYQWKTFAILFSTFEEVLFLDADSMPLLNPDSLFEDHHYRNNGVVLWPDYWRYVTSPWLPYIVGMTADKSDMLYGEQTVESGQMLWNKRTHWKPLLLAAYYAYAGPNFWYTLTVDLGNGWGDKDTFPIALRALRQPFHLIPGPPRSAFLATRTSGKRTLVAMVQSHPSDVNGPPLFFHCNAIKMALQGVIASTLLESHADGHVFGLLDWSKAFGGWFRGLHERKFRIFRERIFSHQRLYEMPQQAASQLHPGSPMMDNESLIWNALQDTACYSEAFGNQQLCDALRSYMQKALGTQFSRGIDERSCGHKLM